MARREARPPGILQGDLALPRSVVFRYDAYALRENKFGDFIVVVQASRLHSPCRQAGRLHHNCQSYFRALPCVTLGPETGDAVFLNRAPLPDV